MRETLRDSLLAIGLLAGTIIGAGVFSLPYIFKSAGISTGLFYLAIAAIIYISIYLMYTEIILKTPGDHRFVGYAKIYLGRWLSHFTVLMTIVGAVLVLTIYLILSQSFANLITDFGAGLHKMIIFWVLGSVGIFLTLRRLAWLESLISVGMVLIIFLIFAFGLPRFSNISLADFSPNFGLFLLPLGPVLFSLAGRAAIPIIVKINGSPRAPIIWGTIIPAIAYAAFILGVLALSPFVTEDAVSGLIGQVPGWALPAIGILGILSLITSYIAIGFDVNKSLELDLKFPLWLQFLVVVFSPLAFYFAGLQNFIALVSLAGGVFLALEGIFIIWMWLRATGRRLTLPTALLGFVFVVALVYEILK